MTFAAPIWLYLTPVIVCILMATVTYGLKQRGALLSRFAAARLLSELTEQASFKRAIIKAALLITGFACIGLALARPQYGVEWTERKARSLDIVFVLDSSKSMLATDLRPTRLERAKYAVLDLVDRLQSDRIGLVAFAGRAFLQTPPTLDYSAFRESLESIGPQIMTRGGSDLGNAILEATKAFPSQNNVKVVVLLTDGEDLGGAALEAAATASKEGIKLYTIGIGTPEGEYLKIQNDNGDEEFVRNDRGEPVRSQLDESTLQGLATATGGSYSRLSDQSLDALYTEVLANLPRQERESEMQEARIERFQWVIAAACILLVLEILIRRRGNRAQIVAALALLALLAPAESKAQDAEEPLPTEPVDLAEALEEVTDDDTPALPAEPLDPRILYNDACNTLAEGKYEMAKANYAQAVGATQDLDLQRDALYNMAHASFQSGETAFQAQDLQAAIEHWKEAEGLFQSAHEIDPSDAAAAEDAQLVQARREALEEFLDQQQNQEQENQEEQDEQQDQQDQSDQQQDEQDQSGEQDEEQESQDSQDGENSEQQDSQQGNEGEPSEEQESSESQDSQNQESSEEGSESEQQSPSEGEQQESTEDPLEDLPQPGEEDGDGEEESQPQPGEESSEEVPEAQQGNTATEGNADGEEIEGMRISEAQDLLDSLRDSERLLPFIDRSQPQKRDNRDW